jgi:hypothetical protein
MDTPPLGSTVIQRMPNVVSSESTCEPPSDTSVSSVYRYGVPVDHRCGSSTRMSCASVTAADPSATPCEVAWATTAPVASLTL